MFVPEFHLLLLFSLNYLHPFKSLEHFHSCIDLVEISELTGHCKLNPWLFFLLKVYKQSTECFFHVISAIYVIAFLTLTEKVCYLAECLKGKSLFLENDSRQGITHFSMFKRFNLRQMFELVENLSQPTILTLFQWRLVPIVFCHFLLLLTLAHLCPYTL